MKILASLLFAFLSLTVQAQPSNCGTVENARRALATYANEGTQGYYLGAGTAVHGHVYTAEDFAELEPVSVSGNYMCNFSGDDCHDIVEAVYTMKYSFEPGRRGMIGLSISCEFFATTSFLD